MRIAYFVHDLADAAGAPEGPDDARLRRGDAAWVPPLRSFCRRSRRGPHDRSRRTADAKLGHRAFAVWRAIANQGEWQTHLAGNTVFIARQLEMLVLAALRAGVSTAPRRWCSNVWDIHRLMLTQKPVGAALRRLEQRLLRSCSMLIVSSPAFVTHHFERIGRPCRLNCCWRTR